MADFVHGNSFTPAWQDGVAESLRMRLRMPDGNVWKRLPLFGLAGSALGFILTPSDLGDGTLQPALLDALRRERELQDAVELFRLDRARGFSGIIPDYGYAPGPALTLPQRGQDHRFGVSELGLYLQTKSQARPTAIGIPIADVPYVAASGGGSTVAYKRAGQTARPLTDYLSPWLQAQGQRLQAQLEADIAATMASLDALRVQGGLLRSRYESERQAVLSSASASFEEVQRRQKLEALQESYIRDMTSLTERETARAIEAERLRAEYAEWLASQTAAPSVPSWDMVIEGVSVFAPGTRERQLAQLKIVRTGRGLAAAAAFNRMAAMSANARTASARLAATQAQQPDKKAGHGQYRAALALINRTYGSLTEGWDLAQSLISSMYVEHAGRRHYIAPDLARTANSEVSAAADYRALKVLGRYVGNLGSAFAAVARGEVQIDMEVFAQRLAMDQAIDLMVGSANGAAGESLRRMGIRAGSTGGLDRFQL